MLLEWPRTHCAVFFWLMIRSIRITMYEVCSQEPSIVSNTHHNISETVNFLLNLEASELAKMYFFYLTFKLLAELINYFIFHYQAQVTQGWLMNHDCCLQSSVCRQVLLFNINQSLLGWVRQVMWIQMCCHETRQWDDISGGQTQAAPWNWNYKHEWTIFMPDACPWNIIVDSINHT